MAHRVRSKTVDSADSKKSKAATPRRLTEKIAIIKKREHEQSAEFEQAMKSIFEMQQARIHSGGGSMPSLQAIDSTPPAPTIDMPSIFRDFEEMKRGSGTTLVDCGPRRAPLARNSSMETEPYLPVGMGSSDHYWNASPEWIDGDLSRHKSDSDLQQSLMMQQQSSPQHMGSPQLHRAHKMTPPNDLWSNKKRPNSATTHALLSPDSYMPPPERITPPPMGGSVGGASSLPDLTTIEFSSGLDVPLERDEPLPLDSQLNSTFPPQVPSVHLLPNALPSLINRTGGPCLSPTSRAAGPSKLIYNSFQAPTMRTQNPMSTVGQGFNYPTPSPPMSGYRQFNPQSGGMPKSPTMPEFRNIHSTNGFVAKFRPPPPAPLHYKPILPSLPNNQSFPPFGGLSGFLPQVGVAQDHPPVSNSPAPPPMTIIIQPPPTTTAGVPQQQQQPMPSSSNNYHHHHQQQQQQQRQDSPVLREPSMSLPPNFNLPSSDVLSPEKSLSNANQYLNGVSPQRNVLPLSTLSPTSFGLCLPSYTEARMQQSLQAKFASINVNRNESMIRSHSEENLQKAQKEKPDVIQHNPFMGTLANANSVPCVYVESSNAENQNERSDSPTTLDSPSTSASYASSPPSVRPYWIEEESTLREYVFREWPLDEQGAASNRPGSPLAHHRSLTDLSTIPEITELVSTNRSHQLSLPSVAMTDLTVDEQLEKGNSPSEYYLPPDADFEMEEAVMNSLLKHDVPDLHPFDVAMLSGDPANVLLSSSPDSFLRTEYH